MRATPGSLWLTPEGALGSLTWTLDGIWCLIVHSPGRCWGEQLHDPADLQPFALG